MKLIQLMMFQHIHRSHANLDRHHNRYTEKRDRAKRRTLFRTIPFKSPMQRPKLFNKEIDPKVSPRHALKLGHLPSSVASNSNEHLGNRTNGRNTRQRQKEIGGGDPRMPARKVTEVELGYIDKHHMKREKGKGKGLTHKTKTVRNLRQPMYAEDAMQIMQGQLDRMKGKSDRTILITVLKETYDKIYQRVHKNGEGRKPIATPQQKQFADVRSRKIAIYEYIQN